MKLASFKILIFFLSAFVGGCESETWIDTENGAIRLNAFDNIQGRIDIRTAYDQDEVCKSYVNGLSNSSSEGISGAVELANDYANKRYYYYKVSSYINFHKNGAVLQRLKLFESKAYFKLPRVAPNQHVLLEKLPELSIAQQLKLGESLKSSNGGIKRFTPRQLAETIEVVVRKDGWNSYSWVLQNFFDSQQRKFMSCVPDAVTAEEREYGPMDQLDVKIELREAYESMRKLTKMGSWQSVWWPEKAS